VSYLSSSSGWTLEQLFVDAKQKGKVTELNDNWSRIKSFVDFITGESGYNRWVGGKDTSLFVPDAFYQGKRVVLCDDGRVEYHADGKVRRVRMGSWVGLCIRAAVEYYESNYSTPEQTAWLTNTLEEIEQVRGQFNTVWGQIRGALNENFISHEVVSGEDIYETYESGWGARSCMVENPHASYMYVKNPQVWSMVRFRSAAGRKLGRMMLCRDDDGQVWYSRLYSPNEAMLEDYIRKLVEDSGWKSIVNSSPIQERLLVFTHNVVVPGEIPYLDGGYWFSPESPYRGTDKPTFKLYFGNVRTTPEGQSVRASYTYTSHSGSRATGYTDQDDRNYDEDDYYDGDDEDEDGIHGNWSGDWTNDYITVYYGENGQSSEYEDVSYVQNHDDLFINIRGRYLYVDAVFTCPNCGEPDYIVKTTDDGVSGCSGCATTISAYISEQNRGEGWTYNVVLRCFLRDSELQPVDDVKMEWLGHVYDVPAWPEYVVTAYDTEGRAVQCMRNMIPTGYTLEQVVTA
jgi:hypothetical protein